MSTKLGRNELCPCDSGKKYKNCCLKKGIEFKKPNKKEATNKLRETPRSFFSKFQNVDLVATLAALSISPSNHGKNLRLEYLTIEALSIRTDSIQFVTKDELQGYLNKYYDQHHLEDPPENLFTENIINPLGNNTVYGGNFSQGAFILNHIISAVSFYKDSFPPEFIKSINDAFLVMLAISNSIATEVGHTRNMLDMNESGNEINFPDDMDKHKLPLVYSNDWLESLCSRFKIDLSVIDSFCLKSNDRTRIENKVGDKDNPLITKPLARIMDGILVASPISFISALIHFGWIQSIAFECKEKLVQTFHDLVWHEVRFFMNKIGFEPDPNDFITQSDLPIKQAYFRFDTDKIVYLSFLYDEVDDYQSNTPCHFDPMSNMEQLQDVQQQSLDLLKSQYPGHSVIDLTLYSSIGREYMLMFPHRGDNILTLITSPFKFLCWIKSEQHDTMDLWYFLKSKEQLEESLLRPIPIDFLDYCNLYQKNKSFYLSDEARPNGLFISDGALNIISKSSNKEDKIVVYHQVPQFNHPVLIPVVKFDGYIPRYFNLENAGKRLEFYIPEYPIDIWIRGKDYNEKIDREFFNIYWDMAEAISFWFSEIKDLLSPHLLPIQYPTFTISFDFDSIELFRDQEATNSIDLSVVNKFRISVEKALIKMIIPGSIVGHLIIPDNEGERIILRSILTGIGQYLEFNELPNSLNYEAIEQIVENKFPLGLKKMILIINTKFSTSLDPRNLTSPRLVQEARVQWYMDEIIPLLGSLCPSEGPVVEKEARVKLGRDIVFSLLKKLREISSQYNSNELLFEFMRNHEAIVHNRIMSNLRTPTRLHCFAAYEDIVEELQKSSEEIDEASLATRCLVEHFAAEPTKGNKPINQELTDDLMALMSLILWWGGLGDRLSYGLFDIEIDVLASGRIGTNSKEATEEFFKNFTHARVREYIDDTVDSFSSFFQEEEQKTTIPVPPGFNTAFDSELGISFDKLSGIVSLLVDLGFDQDSTIAEITFEELKKNIVEAFEVTFSDEEISAAIAILCLQDRGNVMSVPEGFENSDIMPWRYNRRLSYLQRPLVLLSDTSNSTQKLYWTPRHLNQAWHYLNHLFLSARYKAKPQGDLERQLSKNAQGRSKVIQNEVIKWFQEKTNCTLDQEVELSSNGKLKVDSNLGDIDVLAIDHDSKTIFSVECKRTGQAKNPKELIEQFDQYFGSDSTLGYFGKHLRRHNWLIDNLLQVGLVYRFDPSGYVVKSFFVSYEILGIQFLPERPLPIHLFSLYDFKNLDSKGLLKSL